MTALIVVAAIIALFLIIAFLRIGAAAEYSSEGFRLVGVVGFVRITLIPSKEKKKNKGKKRKKKTKSKSKAQKKEKDESESSGDKKGGTVKKVLTVLPTALQALGRFCRHLKIEQLTVRYNISADDPYTVAMSYGYTSGALAVICPMLDRYFKIKKWDVKVYPCFMDTEEKIYIKAKATITVWELVYIILKLDFKAIISVM